MAASSTANVIIALPLLIRDAKAWANIVPHGFSMRKGLHPLAVVHDGFGVAFGNQRRSLGRDVLVKRLDLANCLERKLYGVARHFLQAFTAAVVFSCAVASLARTLLVDTTCEGSAFSAS